MNKTLTLKVGALKKFLSINGYQTLNSFTKRKDGSTILDITTLRRINDGKSIKVDHLEKIGNEVKKSVEEILSFNDNEYFDQFSQKVKINLDPIGTRFKMEGTLVDFEDLIRSAMICDDIYIKLELSSISEELEDHLINFEENLKSYHKNHQNLFPSAPDLKSQIKEKKLYGEIKKSFNYVNLRRNNNFIITSLDYWGTTRTDEATISYDKKRILIITLVQQPIKNINFEITKTSSELPPKNWFTDDEEETAGIECSVIIDGKSLYFSNKTTEFIINENDYGNAVLVDKATNKIIYKREDDSFHF